MKLAIITTHPIQYYAPVFKELQLNGRLHIKVFYTWGEEAMIKFDKGFGKTIQWDIPLLSGYTYEWIKNTAKDKGTHHFTGIINPDLIRKIEAWQPNALLIYGWANSSHLKVLCYFKNKLPVFFRGDSTFLGRNNGLKKMIKKFFLKWVYKHVDYALYAGTRNKIYFTEYGLLEQQLIFAPHAVDNSRFCVDKSIEANDLRISLGILETDIVITFAGKFDQKKDPLTLLHAFSDFQREHLQNNPDQHANVHLLFVGNGLLEQRLKSEAAFQNNIHFLDFQNQRKMPIIYQACDIFCLPSVSETWGLAVNEAMAGSKAILVSDKVGCAIDLVRDGYNGATFTAGSKSNLTENLKILVEQGKGGIAAMGKHSKLIIDKWTVMEQVRAITSAVIKHG